MSEIDFQREVLGLLRGYGERLSSIEGAVSVRCDSHGREIGELKQVHEDHEERIRDLEEHKHYSRGKIAGISAAAGVGGAGLLKLGAWLFGAR